MLQSAKNVTVDFAVEATFNVAPAAGTSERLRFTPSPGLTQKAATIRSNEQKDNSLTSMGRNGSRMVDGSYSGEMSADSHNTIYQAVMRGTIQAVITLTQASGSLASVQVTANDTIQFGGGDIVALGLRLGALFRFTLLSEALNNNINLRVKEIVSPTEIKVMGSPLTVMGPDSAFSMTIAKKLINPSTGPVKRTFTIEQRNVDIDASQRYGGCRWVGMKINGTPDGNATLEFPVLGASMTVLESGASPYFTAGVKYTTVPLVFADANIAKDGSDISISTALELNYTINAATQPVIGSVYSPDVFDNDAMLAGSFTMIRKDMLNVKAFVDETEFDLHTLLQAPGVAPRRAIALHVPRCKFTDASAPLGGDGAMLENLPFQTGDIGEDLALGIDATLMTMWFF